MSRNDPDKPMVDEYLDCSGNKRKFELSVYAGGRFLQAVELRRGERSGPRFVMAIKPGEDAPWGPMRDRIRERLSQRDIVRDEKGEIHDLHRLIRAQITDAGRNDIGTPLLLIDDQEITWEELGQALMTYSGWDLRIEIRDCCEE